MKKRKARVTKEVLVVLSTFDELVLKQENQEGGRVTSRITFPVEQSGLTPYEEPTVPSLVIPGTEEALRRGCICPVEENLSRLKAGTRPVLRRTCRVHAKICQADVCPHSDHLKTHERCEHCTNVLHLCVVCSAVYLEDGDDPTMGGWLFVENDPIVKGWRCRRCR